MPAASRRPEHPEIAAIINIRAADPGSLYGVSRLDFRRSSFGAGYSRSLLACACLPRLVLGLVVRRFRLVCSAVRRIVLVGPIVIWAQSAEFATYHRIVYISPPVYRARKMAAMPIGALESADLKQPDRRPLVARAA